MFDRLAELREKRANGEDGFTLIELLVVVVIIGILIAIAIPLYLNYKRGANDKSAQSDLRSGVSVLEQCNTDNQTYPASLTAVPATGTVTSYTACTNQSMNVSSGTTMNYTPTTTNSITTAYVLASTNANGSGKIYCYNSTKGGQVKDVSGTGVTLANATC